MRALLFPATILLLSAGCFPSGRDDDDDDDRDTDLPAALDAWFDARRVQFTGALLSSMGGIAQGDPQTMEGWFADDMLRLDLDLGGLQPRTLIVRDGTSTFYRYDRQETQPAVAPAEQYLLEHRRPPAGVEPVGFDNAWSCVRHEAVIDTVYQVEGAQNAWYADTIAWCFRDDTLVYLEHIGGLPGPADTLDPNQQLSLFRRIDTVDTEATFDLSAFDAPF